MAGDSPNVNGNSGNSQIDTLQQNNQKLLDTAIQVLNITTQAKQDQMPVMAAKTQAESWH